MPLEKFIANYSIEKALQLESQDEQFLALQNAWKNIAKQYGDVNFHQNIFLFLVLQNSLVSYQIAGGGNYRRQEFSFKITEDFEILKKLFANDQSTVDRRYSFLTNSRYNKRIYNIKTQRLQKFEAIKKELNFYSDFGDFYYENMPELLNLICGVMNQKPDSKTAVFAIKMFGYGARIVFDKIIPYHTDIHIPLDSRLKKIYSLNFPEQTDISEQEIKQYFFDLAQKHKIPPLHLDSVLRLDYRDQFVK